MFKTRTQRTALVIATSLFATASATAQAGETPIGAPQDWSNRAVIYRNAKTPDELLTAGRSADMNRLYRNPRYVAAVLQRVEREGHRAVLPTALTDALAAVRNTHEDRHKPRPKPGNAPSAIQRDWSASIGSFASGKVGMFPAKYNFDVTAAPSCANDFVVYGTNAPSAGTQPSIVAFNQLYQGACKGTWNNNGAIKAPNVMWSYTTGTGFITETSPVLSYLDGGKQVAFVQRNTSNGSLQLVLLKWQAGQGSVATPATPTLSPSAAAYRACASNCYFVIPFSGTSNNDNVPTYSSPYVDYEADNLWVGDGNGNLHKFRQVFQGNPAEVTTGGFPAVVEAGMDLSPPVSTGTDVYVGSQSGSGTVGGKLHRVNASNGSVASSTKLAVADSTGIRESVIIDAGTNSVFAFLFNDGTTGDGTYCQPTDPGVGNFDACRTIVRFATGFANGASPLQRTYVGRGNSRVSALYAGAFDDAYYSSANGTGAMYIVGGKPGTTYEPSLWKVPLTAGVMGNPIQGAQVGNNVTACTSQPNCSNSILDISPVTYARNPNTLLEYIYFSEFRDATASGCTGACVYMYPLNTFVPGTPASNATWTFAISNNKDKGIPSNETGTFTVNGTVLTANTDFSTTGNRDADRTALVTKINTISGYQAQATATAGEFTVTRMATGGIGAANVTENMSRISNSAFTDGSAGTPDSSTPIAWGTGNTPGASLAVTGGTGGIVYDNMRPAADLGSSQVYFTQLDTAVLKRWTMTFAGAADQSSGTFTVNGVTFTGNAAATSCTSTGGNFYMGGNALSDAVELRACLLAAKVPGFFIAGEGNGTDGTVVITYAQKGNPSDTLVTEAIAGTGNVITITQGTASTQGNAIQATQNGLN